MKKEHLCPHTPCVIRQCIIQVNAVFYHPSISRLQLQVHETKVDYALTALIRTRNCQLTDEQQNTKREVIQEQGRKNKGKKDRFFRRLHPPAKKKKEKHRVSQKVRNEDTCDDRMSHEGAKLVRSMRCVVRCEIILVGSESWEGGKGCREVDVKECREPGSRRIQSITIDSVVIDPLRITP